MGHVGLVLIIHGYMMLHMVLEILVWLIWLHTVICFLAFLRKIGLIPAEWWPKGLQILNQQP